MESCWSFEGVFKKGCVQKLDFVLLLSLITFITVQSPIFTFRALCWGSRSRGSFIPDVSLFCFFFEEALSFWNYIHFSLFFLLFFSSFFYSSYKIITFTSKLVREHNCLSSSLRNFLKIRSNKTSKGSSVTFFFIIFCLFFSENKITFDSNW